MCIKWRGTLLVGWRAKEGPGAKVSAEQTRRLQWKIRCCYYLWKCKGMTFLDKSEWRNKAPRPDFEIVSLFAGLRS